MRPIKELLVLLREGLPRLMETHSGLCGCIEDLRYADSINVKERDYLMEYLFKYRPIETECRLWWWDKFDLTPRLEFLDKLIEELTNTEI